MITSRRLAGCDVQSGSTGLAAQHQQLIEHARQPVVQRCAGCGVARFPPLLICPECRSSDLEWWAAGTRGAARSWVTVHTPTSTPTISVPRVLLSAIPYTTVIVEMDEFPGVRVPALHLGSSDDWHAGVAVELSVRAVGREVVPVCEVRAAVPGTATVVDLVEQR